MDVETWVKISDKYEECIAADVRNFEQYSQLKSDCEDEYEPEIARLWDMIRSTIEGAD